MISKSGFIGDMPNLATELPPIMRHVQVPGVCGASRQSLGAGTGRGAGAGAGTAMDTGCGRSLGTAAQAVTSAASTAVAATRLNRSNVR